MFILKFKGKKIFGFVWNFKDFHLGRNPVRKKKEEAKND